MAIRGPHGLGKDLAVETPIPTPDGWTTMGALRPGDVIFDESGCTCRVVYAEEPQWRDARLVRFADGSSVVAGAGHLWSAIDVYHRPKGRRAHRNASRPCIPVADWRDHWDAARTVETRRIETDLRSPGGQLRWRVPTARSLELPEADLPIDPYLLGYWLGDGTTSAGTITVGEGDLDHLLGQVAAAGFETRVYRYRGKSPTVSVPGLRVELISAGVFGHKHIPDRYLRASIAQRRALVQGLWDSDGYRQGGGCDEITLTNKELAADTAELLRSLGLAVRVRQSEARLAGRLIGPRWRIAARFDFNPYRLARYDWTPAVRQASRHTQRTITSVTPVGLVRTCCIAVDSPSQLFLAGEDMIPTHNSAVASMAVLWFATTREAAGVDWKIPTTASVGQQLFQYFWPEIRKWAFRLDWDALGLDPWRRGHELLEHHIKLRHGEAFALTAADPSAIEGAHATELLYVFDEAKAISDGIYDAAEGAFSTAGLAEGSNAYAIAISTPGEPVGRFYEIHARRPGTEAWWVRHVTIDEAIRAGRVTREWVDQQHLLWGDSAVYANRVLGEFAASSEDTVIPLAWVEAACDRWRAIYEPLDPDTGERVPVGRARHVRDGTRAVIVAGDKLHTLGVDVARGGEDRSVIALRQGNTIAELRRYPYSDDTMLLANQVDAIQTAHGDPRAVIDVIGVGAGVYDRQRERGRNCVGFNSSAGTKRTDITGEFGFTNSRSWAWWNLREMLDPASGCDVALPPDDRLIGDLTTPKWKLMSGGRIQIESKDDIRKRLGRSPDDGDAVVYSYTETGGSWADLYRASEEPDPDDDTPQPRGPASRARRWADVYKTREQVASGDDPKPAPKVGPSAAPAPVWGSRPGGGWFR